MLFDELIFDNSTITKFQMYRSLFIQPTDIYQVHFFANLSDLNYQQTVTILSEVDKDLAHVNPNHENVLQRNGKVDLTHLDVGIDEYRNYLLKQSVPFLFLSDVLNEPEMNVEEFCERHQISRSTVSRKLNPLSKFLKKYKIRMTYTPLNLVGNEILIRLTLFYIFWIGVRDIEWPFKVTTEEVDKVTDQFKRFFRIDASYFGRKEIYFVIAVFISRLKHHRYVDDNQEWSTFFNQNEYFSGVLLDGFPELTNRELLNETYFVLFLTHFVPYYGVHDEEQLDVTIENFYSLHPQSPLAIMNQRFMDFIQKDYKVKLDLHEQKMILANILNISFTYSVLNGPFPDFEILGSPLYEANEVHRKLEKNVEEFFTKLFKESGFSRFKNAKESIIRRYTNLVLPYLYKQGNEEKIKVAIAIERNQILLLRLRNFLKSLNFITVHNFEPEHAADYDLVITSSTSIARDFPCKEIFYWDIEYGQKELMYLYQYLQQEYLDRKNA
ncbi:MAG: helix-turn-helix domain-containing protein [Lactobacillales bacterium]|jgi:hypothetical protein|nr:helix-turn-helix domain-containing protein [Lactobacillales bacterium]